MPDTFFQSLFQNNALSSLVFCDFLFCLGGALLVGLILALGYMYRTRYTRSFIITLALLPSVVCVVIMMVNGNIGAGVAVAGAFSLVRFRSVPGTAKEITMLFLAMGAGLVMGMGYIGFAFVFTIIMSAFCLLYNRLDFGSRKVESRYKTLQITIPEDLDYSGVFDDLFFRYTAECELIKVKTTNLGSMFRLTYNITLKDPAKEKEMIDELRCRNGNLEITVSKQESPMGGL